MSNFVLFEETSGSMAEKVILRKNGSIFISNLLKDKYKLKDFKSCLLYVDKDSDRIALSFQKQMATSKIGARAISPEKTGLTINISKILKYFKIGNRHKLYSADMVIDEKSGFFVIDFTEIKRTWLATNKE